MPIFGYRPMKQPDEDEPDVEVDTTGFTKVQRWLYEQFLALEFSPYSSVMLVELGADHHDAKRLLGKHPDHQWVYDQLT